MVSILGVFIYFVEQKDQTGLIQVSEGAWEGLRAYVEHISRLCCWKEALLVWTNRGCSISSLEVLRTIKAEFPYTYEVLQSLEKKTPTRSKAISLWLYDIIWPSSKPSPDVPPHLCPGRNDASGVGEECIEVSTRRGFTSAFPGVETALGSHGVGVAQGCSRSKGKRFGGKSGGSWVCFMLRNIRFSCKCKGICDEFLFV